MQFSGRMHAPEGLVCVADDSDGDVVMAIDNGHQTRVQLIIMGLACVFDGRSSSAS